MVRKLIPKQLVFINEYLIDLNATQAAIRAGYSVNNADKIGSELLGKTGVSNAIDTAMAERSRRTGVTQDRVIQELAKIAFAKMTDFADWDSGGVRFRDSDSLTVEDAACVAEISEIEIKSHYGVKRTKKLKLHSKESALEKLGKHLGMFKDKLELTGKVVFKGDGDLAD